MYVLRRTTALLIIATIIIFSYSNCLVFAKENPHNILILYSQHYSHRWTNELHKGITDSLALAITYVYPEYLNEFMSSDKVDFLSLYTSLKSQYQGINFDCIIIVDNYAFNFMEEYYSDLAPETPIVFVGVNGFTEDMMFTDNMTGIPQNNDKEKSIELTQLLGNEYSKLVFITSNNATSSAELNSYKELLDSQFNGLNYEFIMNDTLEEAIERIKSINDAQLITIGNIKTKDGEILEPKELIEHIFQASQLPIYTMNLLQISGKPEGALGGYVIDPYEHGYEAGEYTKRILNGEKAMDIPIDEYSPAGYVFNYHMLKFFGIDNNILPEESRIIGAPSENIVLNKNIAFSVGGLSFLLAVFATTMIVLLIMKIKDRNKIIESSKSLEQKNKQLISEKSINREKEKENLLLMDKIREQQKLESISILAGGVAHEINNPINGIMNYGQLIMDNSESTDENYNYAKEIVNETNRIAEIVKNLLQYSRRSEKEFSEYSIKECIEGTLSLIKTIIKKDQINLRININENVPTVFCDIQQMQQVIMNLIINARDSLNTKYKGFDQNKQILLSCRPVVRESGEWVQITVEDYGIGISEENINKIFDPFFSTKDRTIGTGLGLSISYGIISDHYGEIKVESKEGKYAKFSIFLPSNETFQKLYCKTSG